MSVVTEVEKKKAEIVPTELLAVVKSKDADNKPWKEVADVLSFTAGGTAFHIERECKVGTLLSLMLAMPAHMRCYDHEKELYRVWGLVQFCQPLNDGGREGFHVGVAFIGKNPPDSYNENADQSYRIRGMDEDGLWKIDEAKSPFTLRRHLRYWTSVELYLAQVDGKRDAIGGEWTTTENVSKRGAAVFTGLDIGVGDRVKLISEKFDFSGLAVVCNRQLGTDGKTRLHIQFVENDFPVERLKNEDQ
jgi:hypothetical protein